MAWNSTFLEIQGLPGQGILKNFRFRRTRSEMEMHYFFLKKYYQTIRSPQSDFQPNQVFCEKYSLLWNTLYDIRHVVQFMSYPNYWNFLKEEDIPPLSSAQCYRNMNFLNFHEFEPGLNILTIFYWFILQEKSEIRK